MTTEVYAYVHCKPDGTPFYVGKGRLRRAMRLSGRNQYHTRTVEKYGKENLLVGMLECSSDAIAFDLEIGMIKCLKNMGVKLTNHTNGGDGGKPPSNTGRLNMSEAAKKRGISQACRDASIASRIGVRLSTEQKLKLSIAMTGAVFTEEHKHNIRESAKKRGMSEACRVAAKVARVGCNSPHSEETKLKMSESAKKRPMSEVCRVAAKASQAARKKSPEELKVYKAEWYSKNKDRILKADKRTSVEISIQNRINYIKRKERLLSIRLGGSI